MLTDGGIFDPRQTQDLTPNSDWENNGIGGNYDMSNLVWGKFFNTSAAAHEVPKSLISIIGGLQVVNLEMNNLFMKC